MRKKTNEKNQREILLQIPANSDGVDAIDVSIACATILVMAPISRSPNKY